MPIRQARYSDLPIMARVVAASFGPDKLFQIMFPHQDQFPDDFVTAFRRGLTASWWDYSKVLMVSYEPESSNVKDIGNDQQHLVTSRYGHSEIITGVAEWQRVGVGWEHVWNVLGWWDPRNLIHKLVEWRNKLLYFLRPCRASAQPTIQDPNPFVYANFFPRIMPFAMHLLCNPSTPWRQNHWSLEILGIHPSYQGQGHGKELAQWGLARAKCDTASGVTGLPSVVISADTKEVFYQKVGFNELVGWVSRSVEGVEGVNPMEERGCRGGAVLWSRVKEDEEVVKASVQRDES